jgi:Holliday junction DNA helicase RuvA
VIGRLRGTLVAIRGTGAVIDVHGVGYEVAMTPRSLGSLPGVGEEVVVHTHLHGREDGMSLFGFASESDRDLFRTLLTASGVGPKLALAVLGSMTGAELRRAVAMEDVDALTVVPGVGKRSAQKLVLELRPKLAEAEAEVVGGSPAGTVRQALEGLGYTPGEIREVVPQIDPALPVADQIKAALRMLARGR